MFASSPRVSGQALAQLGTDGKVDVGRVLPVAEVFGPTFQGEGPYCGQTARFVRLGRCNLSCGKGDASWQCDTAYTWDDERFNVAKECPDTDVDELLTRAAAIPARITVLTGGEPLLHQRKAAFEYFLGMLCQPPGRPFGALHVETNGTIAPTPLVGQFVDHFTVSPKLANSGVSIKHRIRSMALRSFNHVTELYGATVAFKFVCTDPQDLAEVDQLVADHDLDPTNVWIMPGGVSVTEIIWRHRALAEPILQRGYNTTTRLHSLLWPTEERGR
jgi:7-carboxy-7-deazaguanine synthase